MARQTASMRHLLVLSLLLLSVLGATNVVTALDIGEQAPDFVLPSTMGDKISLKQFRGKQLVLIEFYTNDFVPTWTKNLLARKADYSKFQDLNVQVLGISANTPFSQQIHAASLQLPYPLLSDYPDMQTIDDYGVRHHNRPKTTVAKRYYFLVDTQGIVRGKWEGEDLEVFPSEILLKAARDIIAQR